MDMGREQDDDHARSHIQVGDSLHHCSVQLHLWGGAHQATVSAVVYAP